MKDHPYNHMDKEVERIAYLIAGYIRDTLSEPEHEELDKWINASDANMQLFEELTDEKNIWANLSWMDKVKARDLYGEMKQAGSFRIPDKMVRRRVRLRAVWIAAASIVLLACIFAIYKYTGKRENILESPVADNKVLQPGGNRATLKFSDGSVIDLGDAKNGLLKSDKGSDVRKLGDGELLYVANDSVADRNAMQTLSTPAGGQFQVRLPDGTKVWLNASSVLTYPAMFSGRQRDVGLRGEAYFEVAKNEKQPFKIALTDSTDVTVLGTHFNIQSYPNEELREVTLLEGTVSVETKSGKEKLSPGMQAVMNGEMIKTRAGVDTEEITGWKNGLFVFHDAPIESIMRQVERWYDAKVVYKGTIHQAFNATILRREPLSKLLHLLELNGYVHFKIENNTIYVLP